MNSDESKMNFSKEKSHHHHHHHHHQGLFPKGNKSLKRMKWVLFLNLGFAVIQLVGGFWTGSLAILSGAIHDFGDSMALLVSYFFEKYASKSPNSQYTYGYKRYSAVAALITGSILIFGSSAILFETLPRLLEPREPHSMGMIFLAVLGLLVNGFAVIRLSGSGSMSEKMLKWHLLEDVASWALVLAGGILFYFTRYTWIDPLMAILVSIWILKNVLFQYSTTLKLFLQTVPEGFEPHQIREKLKTISHVKDVHHIHVWTLDGENHILTAHVVLDDLLENETLSRKKEEIKHMLLHEGIFESTIEIEGPHEVCSELHCPS